MTEDRVPSNTESTVVAPQLEPKKPPKRLGLAITGTALAGHGLLVVVSFSIVWARFRKDSREEGQGPVICQPRLFVALGGIIMATGGLIALVGRGGFIRIGLLFQANDWV